MRALAGLAAVVAVLAVAPPALGHATISPYQLTVGEVTDLNLTIYSDRSSAVVGVELDLPPGTREATVPAVPGWTPTITRATDPAGGAGDVTAISWQGTGTGDGQIKALGYKVFPLRVTMPEATGRYTLPVLQHYADGVTARLDGPPEAPNAGPEIILSDAGAAASTGASDDGGGTSVVVVAVAMGLVAALLVGGFALLARRRRGGAEPSGS